MAEQNELLALANKLEGSSMDSLHFEIVSADKDCGVWELKVKTRKDDGMESTVPACIIIERLLDRYNKEGRHYDVLSLSRDGPFWILNVLEVQLQ